MTLNIDQCLRHGMKSLMLLEKDSQNSDCYIGIMATCLHRPTEKFRLDKDPYSYEEIAQ